MGRRKSPAALAVAVGIFLSRVAGLVRDRVFAYYLGNSAAAGAFRAALRIPNFLQNLFGEGVLSASFIPVYARARAEGRNTEATRLAGAVAAILGIVVTTLAAMGVIGAPWLIDILAPGFKEPGIRALTIQLVRIMFPGVALLVLSAWCLGVLNSHRYFLLSYVAPVLWNIAIIAALLWSGSQEFQGVDHHSKIAVDVAWGTLVGCFLQLLVQMPLVLRLTKGMVLNPSFGDPAVRTVLRNFLPVLTSRGVVQVSAYIDGVIASFLGPAIYSAMAYAQTLYLLPISLFGMSISAAELPSMSSVVGNQESIHSQVRLKLTAGLGRVAYFVIPSVVAMALLGDLVIGTIYQTGEFRASDVMDGWVILGGYTVGLLASTQGRLCSTTFYALGDSRTPLKYACIRVAIAAIGGIIVALPARNILQISPVEAAGLLAAVAGLAGWIEYLCLRRSLKQLLGDFRVEPALGLRLWGFALCSAVLAFTAKKLLPTFYPAARGIAILAIYGSCYLGATIVFNIGQGARIRSALTRRFR